MTFKSSSESLFWQKKRKFEIGQNIPNLHNFYRASFKYINFNLKITLPLLLSEQTSVLGKVFEFIFPARVLNKQIAVYKDTSSVDVFLAEIGLSPILFFNLQSIRLA